MAELTRRVFAWRRLVPILGCAAALACESLSDTRDIPVVVSDSAGIPVYRLTGLPPWDDEAYLWDLELEFSFSTVSANPNADPLVYRPQGYTRMPDGTLVILDGSDERLVVADPASGEVLARFGPNGQGPGEIRSSNTTLWPADDSTFWALDQGNVRLSRFSLSGTLEEERPIGIGGMGGMSSQRVGSGEPWSWKVFLEDQSTGILRDSVGRFVPETGDFEFVVALPERPSTSQRNTSRMVLFDAQSWFAPVAEGVVVGRNDTGRFHVHSEAGAALGVLEVPMEQRPIDAAEEADILEEFYGVAGGMTLREPPEIAEEYPLYNIMWQVNDTLFAIQQSHRATPAREPRIPDGQFVWRVFSVTGRYAGAIAFPPGVNLPYWIEDGRVIATHRDELGVATIEGFLVRPPL